jgi:hypothetical protein
MKHHVHLLLACVITLASSTCFRPKMACAPCVADSQCGENLRCTDGLCVVKDTRECLDAGASDTVAESASESPAPDSDTSVSDTSDSSPEVAVNQCIDRCCIGASCLEFRPRLRNGLLLWADRTSLGQPGSDLKTWYDRSEHGHDIMSLLPAAPPHVGVDLVGPFAEFSEMRTSMATAAGPSLRLGTEDFSILALTRCNVTALKAPVFSKQKFEPRPRTGLSMSCNHDGAPLLSGVPQAPNRAFLRIIDDNRLPEPTSGMLVSQRTDIPGRFHVLTARRVEGRRIQLRVDGGVEQEITVDISLDLIDETPIFVGTVAEPPYLTSFTGGIAALVVVRGPLTDQELQELEDFLISTGGEGAPKL